VKSSTAFARHASSSSSAGREDTRSPLATRSANAREVSTAASSAAVDDDEEEDEEDARRRTPPRRDAREDDDDDIRFDSIRFGFGFDSIDRSIARRTMTVGFVSVVSIGRIDRSYGMGRIGRSSRSVVWYGSYRSVVSIGRIGRLDRCVCV
jgi:hypothetical protein